MVFGYDNILNSVPSYFVDSTVDALMAIDDSQLMRSPNDSGNSVVLATALVHKAHESGSHSSQSKGTNQNDSNNNRRQGGIDGGSGALESTNIDDLLEGDADVNSAMLTQKDIDDLKAELKMAQEEVRKVRLEADKGKSIEPSKEAGKKFRDSWNCCCHFCHSSNHSKQY